MNRRGTQQANARATGALNQQQIFQRRRIAAAIIAALVLIAAIVIWHTAGSSEDTDTGATAESTTVLSRTLDATSPAEPPNQAPATPDPEDQTPAEEPNSSAAKPTDEAKPTDSPKREVAPSSAKRSESPKATPASRRPAPKATCGVKDLVVISSPGTPSFERQDVVNFFVQIKNPTKAECVVDFDQDKLLFEVFTLRNYQRVWGDTDCNSPEVTGKVKIPAGKAVNYQLGGWSRTSSAPGQCQDRKPVPAGSYLLYTHVGENISEPVTFNLAK